ncbi:transcriptional regulator, LacI family [Pseudopedobacter saltans DSM 12145]|uniref:Transcriptional regulator, LacI family n=1 Tax=Pseudopedobacter saltans (strain ATCC 51119 / DSM 12145 / JCM 21818 / CCUG 39354 / LMG 10337 / NBRC 100064 / NCIMB 13643) TaxID=762903 RepID=F0S842_PSESL|nr:LacI family DNA-binding transcriptional regulator [Pseudopedobacter saltans]ADY52304.1 transcriptional regulator, LacI family [Pseudopedobacter saltans DSM 12145]
MAKKVTIKDIAKELNTNYSTVSRALNDHPRISEETKSAVKLKAKQLGYKPNLVAQQLKSGHSKTIGLVVPRINRVFFSNVIDGIEIVAKKNGYNVLICQSYESAEEEYRNIQTLLSNNIAGLIVSLTRETYSSAALNNVLQQEVPLVLFDRTTNDCLSNKVVNDNYYGAYQLTSHLLQKGYRKIVHFSGPLHLASYNERLQGYRDALSDHNITPDDNLIIEDILTREKGSETTKSLVKKGLLFDAIFAASDFSALGAMLYLKEVGIKIPEEIAIAGFANEPFTELLGITSIEQFSKNIGEKSAELLLKQIMSKSQHQETIKIKPELIIRKSTNKKL